MNKAFILIAMVTMLALPGCRTPSPEYESNPPTTQVATATSVAFEGAGVSASAIAISPDGAWLAAVNPDSGSVSLLSLPDLELKSEIKVGPDPRTLTFSADSELLYVPNYGGNSIMVVNVGGGAKVSEFTVGPMPYSAIEQKGVLYVAEYALGHISAYDAKTGELRSQLDLEAFPVGLALDPDSGRLYVTHLFSGKVSLIDLSDFSLEALSSTGINTNLSQFILLDLAGKRAYLPQTRSNTTNMALVFDATVFPLVNVLDLTSQKIMRAERVSLDMGFR